MKLFTAYLCYSCYEVFERAPYGKCQVCDSDSVYPLGWFGKPEEEKAKWFSLINRGSATPKSPMRQDLQSRSSSE